MSPINQVNKLSQLFQCWPITERRTASVQADKESGEQVCGICGGSGSVAAVAHTVPTSDRWRRFPQHPQHHSQREGDGEKEAFKEYSTTDTSSRRRVGMMAMTHSTCSDHISSTN